MSLKDQARSKVSITTMDHITIMEAIGKHCDNKTRFNLCCSHYDFWCAQRQSLATTEACTFGSKMHKLLQFFPKDKNKSSRLRYMHRICSHSLKFNHVIRSELRDVILQKLSESLRAGMTVRKYKHYYEQLSVRTTVIV